MSSDDEAKESDSHHCSDHTHVSERFFLARVVSNNVGDYTEAWENKNVDFGVPEEPEQVLVKDGVSPAGRVKEGSV